MLLLALLVAALAAGEGTLEERVTCAHDPALSYALYLPAGFDPAAQWPVLVVMDPRGRALRAVEPYLEAADTYGWVVASSYDTASDTLGEDPNGRAVAGVLTDLEDRVRIEHDAIALAGFSGTARAAWEIASVLPEAVYAVLSVGAGTPRGGTTRPVRFAVYGVAGAQDFNFHEVRRSDADLREIGVPHRWETFSGGHQWPPAAVSTRMLAWVEVIGQGTGRRARDEAALDAALAADRAFLAGIADPWEASIAHDAVARAFDGLRDVGAERAEAERLAAHPAVIARQREEERLGREEDRYRARLAALDAWITDPNRAPPSPAEGLATLGVQTYVKRAEKQAGTPKGDAAARQVALTWSTLTFYAWRRALAQGDPHRAAAALAIAAEIRDDPVVTYNLACAWAQSGAETKALSALEHAVDLGFTDAAHLRADPDLEPLHPDPRYQALLDRLGEGSERERSP